MTYSLKRSVHLSVTNVCIVHWEGERVGETKQADIQSGSAGHTTISLLKQICQSVNNSVSHFLLFMILLATQGDLQMQKSVLLLSVWYQRITSKLQMTGGTITIHINQISPFS